MVGGQGYSRRPGLFVPVVAALAAMLAVALAYSGPAPFLIASVPVLAALLIIPRLDWGGWFFVYLSIALSILYTSAALPAAALVPVYSVALLRFTATLPMNVSPKSGVVGPSSAAVLRPLPLFLFASLANYRVVFSVAALAASVLVFALIRYAALSRFRVTGIHHDREVRLGGRLLVRVNTEFRGSGYALVSLGGASRVFRVSGTSSLVLGWRPPSVGRFSLMLTVVAFDPWFVAGRVAVEVPISITVIPAYAGLARRYRRELASIPSIVAEPVKTEVLIIGGAGESATVARGLGGIERYLARLPQFVRSVAKSVLLTLAFSGGGRGVAAEAGLSRGVFGEYYGVREFVPGDTLRAIHWKKSVSLGRLVVKEFVSGESVATGSIGTGEYAPIIIADLTPSNTKELDKLIATLLNTLYTATKTARGARTLLIMVFGDIAITLEGTVEEVTARVADAFAKVIPGTIHEYSTISAPISEETAETIIQARDCCALIKTIAAATLTYTRNVTEALIRHGLTPPKTAAVIHGRPTTLRNTALRNHLSRAGYKVISLAETPTNKPSQAKTSGTR